MKQVLIKSGQAVVEDVPSPKVEPKNILVAVEYSCVSVGTEMTGIKMSSLPLYKRALKQPHHVKKVMQLAKDEGIRRTWSRVSGMLASGMPTGYSAAGRVIAVGEQVAGFKLNDIVACAGAGIANHAEVINVPVNLAVHVPDGVSSESASTVTLGAIALQGVRRANPTLGETIVVIGLGILGQITVQLLKANGCKVIGIDVDTRRTAIACEYGAIAGIHPDENSFIDRANSLTNGIGADAVIITAATESSELISKAMQSARKKGRIIVVGDIGMDIDRNDLYKKELDVFISTSYGPGRYDPNYEIAGQDYPLPYVRWTENRNMQAYLELISSKQVDLAGIPNKTYPVDSATEAYSSLKQPGEKPLLVFLSYEHVGDRDIHRIELQKRKKNKTGRINVGLIGAGGFAQGVHLPNLMKLRDDYSLRAVASKTGANAKSAAQRYEADYATTDYDHILNDEDIDLVIICTRHNLHADITLAALKSDKNVLVEKPLAITPEQLTKIKKFYDENPAGPILMTGFNRRFSPVINKLTKIIKNRTSPLIVNYRMNAGYIPLEHWVHGEEGGGRNIGEACHIYDLFIALTQTGYENVEARAINSVSGKWSSSDNFITTIAFSDGSLCTLTYTSMGDKSYPKEKMEIFFDGKILDMIDYKTLNIFGLKIKGWKSPIIQKGQFEELKILAECIRGSGDWPIPLQEQIDATEISFLVEKRINSGFGKEMDHKETELRT